IPSIARSITTASFKSTISELTIGKNIVFIEPYAISKFTKIICYKNSYAHKYAVDNGYNFELISNDIEKLEITNAPSSLSVGEQLKLNIKISPLDAENKDLVFSSSDENIATIDNNGTITAKKKGNVTITVKTKDNLIFTSCNFNVKNIAISEIVVLNKSFSIEKDNTLQINTIITPENATNKTLIYESSNEDIATVDKNGLITAKEKGNAIIKIRSAEDSTQVTININVYIKGEEILIEKIQMDKNEYYLSVDDILNFKLTLTPSNATNTNVTFTSSNNNILKCENDIIKGVSSGTVTLTVTSPNDENIKTSCTVNVYLTGDINKDNKINTLDALYILKYIAKIDVFTELQAVAADFNKDGKINTLDALNVLKKVAQIK
ncbi:MAG: Ig-like domain-containing protein, partial [Clostridia bacterium]